jgi:hypothetical protein
MQNYVEISEENSSDDFLAEMEYVRDIPLKSPIKTKKEPAYDKLHLEDISEESEYEEEKED